MRSVECVYGMDRLRAIACLTMAMVLAGSSVVVGKVLVVTLPVFLATFLTLLVALLGMVPLMGGRLAEIRRLTRREWLYLMLQGLCGIVLFRVFTLYGLQHTGALQAGIVTGTTPAVLTLLCFLFLGEKPGKRAMLGVLCSVAGCFMINCMEGGDSGSNHLFGTLLVMLAVVSEALFSIFRKRIATSVSAVTNTFVLIFCSIALLLIPALFDLVHLDHFPDMMSWSAILYYGLIATVVAYLLWTSAVGKVDGATAGAATAAMPASSVILATVLLGEHLNRFHLAGLGCIVFGILVITTEPRGGANDP